MNEYHIEDNDASIQSNLETWLNRPPSEELNPEVLQVKQIEDTTSHIILFQLDNGDYGYARLLKGLNGKFKIDVAGYGSGIYNSSYQVIETNKGEYLVLYGENPDLKIDHILATALSNEYDVTFDISNEQTFLQSAKIPSDVERAFPVDLSFYDDADNLIE
ncbi:hypothetical protein [Planococcus halotolerans]|uniref:Uncharacterized protein n=2 Tax=Planococcus halotolerans TaxID=2233542 RepID=A0A365KX18_9BACL|nr:hypothetical protein [Planococcus halotolerans]QHJ72289.1 hypothetical protein DNR44_017510 [Planococcus halotolerans]RAZ77690.1 hypothetical protein DP120_09405 [Planococcus halotolerans]